MHRKRTNRIFRFVKGLLLATAIVAGLGYLAWRTVLKDLVIEDVEKYILIFNETDGTHVCTIHIRTNPGEDWGSNWLESPVLPGEMGTIFLPRTAWPESFEGQARDCQGAVIEERTLSLKSFATAPEGLEPGEGYYDWQQVRKEAVQWYVRGP